MGATHSLQEGDDGDPKPLPTWIAAQADPNASWRSEAAKELDKLGGASRRAVKKGDSFNQRLELLQDKLKEQGEEIEEALAKDPLAGRHEIIRQEELKALTAAQLGPDGKPLGHRGAVHDWAGKNHHTLRSELRTIVGNQRERANSLVTPSTPPPSDGQTAGKGRGPVTSSDGPPGSAGPTPKGGQGQGWNSMFAGTGMRDKKTDMRSRIQDYYINMEASKQAEAARKREEALQAKLEQHQQAMALQQSMKRSGGEEGEGGSGRWRENVLGAKKKAWKTLAPMMKLQVLSQVRPNRGLQRVDSFSFYVQNILGPELKRFQEEAAKHSAAARAEAEARAQLEDINRQRLMAQLKAQEEAAAVAAAAEDAAEASAMAAALAGAGGSHTLSAPHHNPEDQTPGTPRLPSIKRQASQEPGAPNSPTHRRSLPGTSASAEGLGGRSASGAGHEPLSPGRLSTPGSSTLTSPTGTTSLRQSLLRGAAPGSPGPHRNAPLASVIESPDGSADSGAAPTRPTPPATSSPLRPSVFHRPLPELSASRVSRSGPMSLLATLPVASGDPPYPEPMSPTASVPSASPPVGPAPTPPPTAPPQGQGAGLSQSATASPARPARPSRQSLVASSWDAAATQKALRPTARPVGFGSSVAKDSIFAGRAAGPGPAALNLAGNIGGDGHAFGGVALTARRASIGGVMGGDGSPMKALTTRISGSGNGAPPVPRGVSHSVSGAIPSSMAGRYAFNPAPPPKAPSPVPSDSIPPLRNRRSSGAGSASGAAPAGPAAAASASAAAAGQPAAVVTSDSVRKSIVGSGIALEGDEATLQREQVLLKKLHDGKDAQAVPLKMMRMYAHRCNARWPEAQKWSQPVVQPVGNFSATAGAAQFRAFRDGVQRMLRAGAFAFQIFVGDDYVQLSDVRKPISLWSADPWELLTAALPGRAANLEHVEGVSMGARALLALACCTEAAAGHDAVRRLCVVVHCNEDQESSVIEDLRVMRWCGLNPANIVIVPEARRPGYVFDETQARFIKRMTSPKQQAGSGFCMMQLAWVGEGFVLMPPEAPAPPAPEEPSSGLAGVAPTAPRGPPAAPAPSVPTPTETKVRLKGTVLEYLEERGVIFLISRRLHDLSIYPPDSVIDLDTLAYGLFLHEQHGANMLVQVDLTPNPRMAGNLRSSEGLVLGHKNHRNPVHIGAPPTPGSRPGSMLTKRNSPWSTASTPAAAAAAARANGSSHAAQGASSAPPTVVPGSGYEAQGDDNGLSPGDPTPVVVIKGLDYQTPAMANLLAEVRAQEREGRLAASTGRYVTSLQHLREVMTSPSVFRPSLDFHEGVVHVQLDAADLTAAPGSYCVAIGNKVPARTFASPEDSGALLAAVHAQDSNGHFRRLLGAIVAGTVGPGAHGSGSGAGASDPEPSWYTGPRPALGPAPPPTRPTSLAPTASIIVRAVAAPVAPSAAAAAALAGESSAGPGLIAPVTNGMGAVPGARKVAPGGQRVLLLVANNPATYTAMQLVLSVLRPGKDSLQLVTMVQSQMSEAEGRELCMRFQNMAKGTLTETTVEVVLKNSMMSTVEQLGEYVEGAQADLVVMGSEELSGGAMPMGSISIGLLKAISKPVILVKSDAKKAKLDWTRDTLKCLVQVEHNTRPLLRYVCTRILNPNRQDQLGPGRSDTLLLARSNATDRSQAMQQDVSTARRLLDNFADIASGLRFDAVKKPLDGAFEEDGCKFADTEKAHVVAVQAPVGRAMPDSILRLIRHSSSAVLVYKTQDAW